MPNLNESNLVGVPTLTPDAEGQAVANADVIRTVGVDTPAGLDLQSVLDMVPQNLQRTAAIAAAQGLSVQQTALLRLLARARQFNPDSFGLLDNSVGVFAAWNSFVSGEWMGEAEVGGGYIRLAPGDGGGAGRTSPVRTNGRHSYISSLADRTRVAWIGIVGGTGPRGGVGTSPILEVGLGHGNWHPLLFFGVLRGEGHDQRYETLLRRLASSTATESDVTATVQVYAYEHSPRRQFAVHNNIPFEFTTELQDGRFRYHIPDTRADDVTVTLVHGHGDPRQESTSVQTLNIVNSTPGGPLAPIVLGTAPNRVTVTPNWLPAAGSTKDGILTLTVTGAADNDVAMSVSVSKTVSALPPGDVGLTYEYPDGPRLHTEDLRNSGITIGIELDNGGNHTTLRWATHGFVAGTQSGDISLGYKIPDEFLSELQFWGHHVGGQVDRLAHPSVWRVECLGNPSNAALGSRLRDLVESHAEGNGIPNIVQGADTSVINLPDNSTMGGSIITTFADRYRRVEEVLLNDIDITAYVTRTRNVAFDFPEGRTFAFYDTLIWLIRYVSADPRTEEIQGQVETRFSLAPLNRKTQHWRGSGFVRSLRYGNSGDFEEGNWTHMIGFLPRDTPTHHIDGNTAGKPSNQPDNAGAWAKFAAEHRGSRDGNFYPTRVHWTLIGVRHG